MKKIHSPSPLASDAVKHLVHTIRPLKKGAFLNGHCGGGRDKKAPSDGYVLSFSTANSHKEAADANTTDEVFLSAWMLEEMTKKR